MIYGATDDGDPWCVVKDANEEVLVHVARIGSKFVVHFAAQDTLDEGSDLPSALSSRLGDMHFDAQGHGGDVVVPFSLAGRQAQSILALIVATAFFYETRDALPATADEHDLTPPSDSAETAVATTLLLDTADKPARDPSAHAVVLADPRRSPRRRRAHGPPTNPPRQTRSSRRPPATRAPRRPPRRPRRPRPSSRSRPAA